MADEELSGNFSASSSSQTTAPGPVGSSVIPIVNKLQDIFAQLGNSSTIDLPQVAVVGSQSSGKSSVLEALVGRDFLPRGSDICTRRPLVLQLVHMPRRPDAPAEGGEEWGEFLHLPEQKFYDFSEIRREIQVETDREAGGNKGVSDKQIRLKIFSPNVLNIALVDLPGITKVPVGDQPSDIETRIRTMILSYIMQETCIILAVSPANADLSNSDALQMARIADPNGSRTVGVITKLDIMDKGTDAQNFLLGNVIPLRLGYVGVVNRSQQDINFGRSIKDALENEEFFFLHHHVYHGLSHCCGIPQLAKKLNQILVQHIKAVLPGLKSRINSQLVAVAKEHAAYGDVAESKVGQSVKLLNILTKYCEAFASMIDGKNDELSTTELSGGARIYYIFQSIFVKSLEEVDPCADVTDDDIRTAIQNATGPKSSLFVPDVPFEVLVRRQIGRLLDPSLQCAKFIYDELIKMSHCCLANELHRYPVLRKCMDEVVGNFLREALQPAEKMITHLIEMEMDYINTSHLKFIGGSNAVETALQQVKASRVAVSVCRPKVRKELKRRATGEMVLKVFGLPFSTCTGRVLACLEEIGLEYELIHVDLPAGEHKRPPHIERNPFGKIPALQDEELVLFESRVINRYLVRKYGKGTDLLKEDSLADAVAIDQWMEVETQHFNGPTSALVFQHLILPTFYGSTADEQVVAAEVEKLEKVLDVYEAKLSKTKFLAGDFYSLADLHHLTYGYYFITGTPHGSLISSRPHVKAWWDSINSRPASKKVTTAMSLTRSAAN